MRKGMLEYCIMLLLHKEPAYASDIIQKLKEAQLIVVEGTLYPVSYTHLDVYKRQLYARAGIAYSYLSGEEMVKYTEEQILDLILKDYKGKKIYLLAPLVRSRKGHYRELFEQIRKKGYLYVRVDGEVREITHGMKLDRYKNHDVEVVIDKLVVAEKDDRRLKQSVATACLLYTSTV